MKTNDLFQQACLAHQQQAWPQADALYQQCIAQHPQQADAWHAWGLLAAQQQQIPEAVSRLQQAIHCLPTQAEFYCSLAQVYQQTHQHQQVTDCYLQGIEHAKNPASCHRDYGLWLYGQKQWTQALLQLAKAIQHEPGDVVAHYNLALILLRQEKIHEAITELNNVLSLMPDNIAARKLLAGVYLQIENFSLAHYHYQLFINAGEMCADSFNNLGVVYLKQNQFEQAMQWFTKALAVEPKHLGAKNNCAALYLQQDRYENAKNHYAELLSWGLVSGEDNTEVLYNLAVAEMALGELSQAQNHFQQLLQTKPQHVDALVNLAATYLKVDQPSVAIKIYQQVLEFEPHHEIACYMLAAISKTETPPEKPPTAYVRNLFDNYAGYYNQHMQQGLNYSVPEQLFQLIQQCFNIETEHCLLDLGCGTGLAVSLFPKLACCVGVDLSKKMLSIAANTSHYDQLHDMDILSYFDQYPKSFNIILAADVLVYFGELRLLFQGIAARLLPQGIFACSIESQQDQHSDYQCHTSGRYSHALSYLRQLADEVGLNLVANKAVTLRKQAQQPVRGQILVFQKVL